MKKKQGFPSWEQWQRRGTPQMHLVEQSSHVDEPQDEPREKTLEELDKEIKEAEWEKSKAETRYWEQRRQANEAGVQSGPASNDKRRRFSSFVKKRPYWR